MSPGTITAAPVPVNSEWREVPSLPGYRVSADGRVQRWRKPPKRRTRRTPLHILPHGAWVDFKPQMLPNGYMQVQIKSKLVRGSARLIVTYVHAMMLEAFIGPRPTTDYQACHGNGVRSDNRIDNLRWGTKIDNAADMARHGTRPMGSRHGIAKLTEGKVVEIKSMLHSGTKVSDLAKKYGVCSATILNIKNRKVWRHIIPPTGPATSLPHP